MASVDCARTVEVPDGPLTVGQVVTLYERLAEGGENLTGIKERHRLRWMFVRFVNDKLVSECRRADLTLFISQQKTWVSDWTIMRAIRTIQTPFNWAMAEDLIAKNPFGGMKCKAGGRRRPMTLEERQAFLRASDPAFRRAILFLHYCGARPGEMRCLEWSMVDRARSVAVLLKHKTAHSRRDKRPRSVVLHPVLMKLIAWIERNKPHERFIFTNSKGKPWTRTAIDQRIARMRRRLGISLDCKLYGLRHAFATRAAKSGIDAATLAELLGHTSITMSQHYIHMAGQTDHLREAVKKVMRF